MKPLCVLLLTITLVASACSRQAPRALSPEQAGSLLVNRNWLSKMPEGKKDRFHVFRFIPEFNHSGVYQDRTIFAGGFELFGFEHTGEEIRFNLLHTGDKKTVHYRIEELRKGEGPANFDLRLTFDRSPRGPATFYGWRSEGQGKDDREARSAAVIDREARSAAVIDRGGAVIDKTLDQNLSHLLKE